MRSYKLQTVIALVALLALTTGGIWPAIAQDEEVLEAGPGTIDPAGFKPGEILVKFKDDVSVLSVQSIVQQNGATRIRTLYGANSELWAVPEGQELAVVEELKANPAVEYAEPNYLYRVFDARPAAPLGTPNDPYFADQWAHTKIKSPGGWDRTTGSSSIIIAVIDTGVDLGHPDLAGKLVSGYDFVENDNNPWDLNGHGTHVAGIAAAIGNNGIGVAGMDWQARIMPVVVATSTGVAYTSDIVSGIYWAYQHGADVLNLSLGGPAYSQPLQDAVTAAHDSGSLVVAAMGNYRTEDNPTNYPAANAHVMAVAATGRTDLYAPYSQYGAHCDISAPGGDMTYLHDRDGILSTMPTYPVYLNTAEGMSQNYDYNMGTSMATPYVVGLAALVWSTDPSLTPDQVQLVIQNSADDLGAPGWDPTYGHGRINVQAALASNAPPPAPELSPIANSDGDGSYVVEWSQVAEASNYTLQEDESASFETPRTISTGTSTSYPVVGKAPGTSWYYRVRASNASGFSPFSNVEMVAMVPAAPSMVPIENAGQEDEYVVMWSAATGATGYTLWQSTSSACSNPIVRYKGVDRQVEVTGQDGGTWYYCALASNSSGTSSRSSAVSTIVLPPALDPPDLAAIDNTDADGDYEIEWGPVPTSPVTYTLEQSRNPYFVNPTVVYSGSALTYPVLGQSAGTWHYRVRAFGPEGKSPWGDTGSTKVGAVVFLPRVARNHSSLPPDDGWETIMSEGFEGTFPQGSWDVADNNGALAGWYNWGKGDCGATAGDFSAWAVGAGSDGQYLACGSPYPNNADSWMVYGPFSLADAVDAELQYEAWVNVYSEGDQLCYMASIDNAEYAGYCTTDAFPQRSWRERVLDLKDVYTLGDLRGEPEVWIAFIFTSDSQGSAVEGVHVDNVLLRKRVGAFSAAPQGIGVSAGTASGDDPATMTRNR